MKTDNNFLLETPRNITIARKPEQTHEVTILGRDQFNNPKEMVIFCTKEEKAMIEKFDADVIRFERD